MKKQILLFTLFLTIALNVYSQFGNLDTINFEKHRELVKIDTSQKGNIWQIGSPHKTFFDSAYSKPYAIVTDTTGYYPVKNISSFNVILPGTKAPGGNWNSCMVPHIYYWQKFDMDTLKDSGKVEISADMGKTWKPLSYYSIYTYPDIVTGHSKGWVQEGPDITPANYCSGSCHFFPTCDTALLRFTFYSDSINTNKEGWMIDNILSTFYECEGIDEHIAPGSNISIYPNPANTSVTISYQLENEKSNAELKLYNAMGQLIESKNISSVSGTLTEDVTKLQGGIYYYTLTVNGLVTATNKLVIIR
jgi:hypothetical protein